MELYGISGISYLLEGYKFWATRKYEAANTLYRTIMKAKTKPEDCCSETKRKTWFIRVQSPRQGGLECKIRP